MKFSHFTALEKHAKSADPDHLSDLYIIIDSEEFVQKKAAELLAKKEERETYFLDEMTLEQLSSALQSFSMFSKKRTFIFYRFDKALKALQKKLLKSAEKIPKGDRYIICTPAPSKELTMLHKLGVILDLSGEKPWEKDKRLSLEIQEIFYKNNRRISSALADQIVKMCASSASKIHHEVEKLLCFSKDQKEVVRSDLQLILPSYDYSVFKMAAAVIEGSLREALMMLEKTPTPFMLLLYSIRSLVQRLICLKELGPQEVAHIYPNLRGSYLQKHQLMSQKRSKQELKKMLEIMFEVELLMKSLSLEDSFLSQFLILKLGAVYEPLPV